MKLTFGLLLAAVAATSTNAFNFDSVGIKGKAADSGLGSQASSSSGTASNCPDACLAYMSPVFDENGVEYPNECYMRAAKCKDKKSTDPAAKSAREKLFGRKKFFDNRVGSDEGDSASSASGDSSAGSSKGLSINCAVSCPKVFQPVTDENGTTYSSECTMRAMNCKNYGGPSDLIAEAELLGLFQYSDSNSGSDAVGSTSEKTGASSVNKFAKGEKVPMKLAKEAPTVSTTQTSGDTSTEQTSQLSIV
ncbi:hypothetical protein PHYBOEH_008832 [Phytophthora boehmeriae]|uniref:Kazal-like domain-containing protein n=1 Tax=Phytophthora boehmeriae TaxID=109152 RepID=A0A8T1X7H2_9STRA|nr:hypothetical protein PHYBOEH_008832 [Phytophthora boehmeriae]